MKETRWHNCEGLKQMRKQKTIKIKINVGKVAMGHQPHTTGSGVHDSRPKRQRTRSAQRRAAIYEFR